jgi:hypothetical protein
MPRAKAPDRKRQGVAYWTPAVFVTKPLVDCGSGYADGDSSDKGANGPKITKVKQNCEPSPLTLAPTVLRSLELRMETVKALKASQHDLFVAESLAGPTFQNSINAESFDAMKFAIFQIGVVNDFGEAKHGSLTNTEPLNQRFHSTAIALVAKLRLDHVIP